METKESGSGTPAGLHQRNSSQKSCQEDEERCRKFSDDSLLNISGYVSSSSVAVSVVCRLSSHFRNAEQKNLLL